MDIAFRMLVELSRTETGSLQRELTENALLLSRAWARTLPYAWHSARTLRVSSFRSVPAIPLRGFHTTV
jgi:hypothetical protein